MILKEKIEALKQQPIVELSYSCAVQVGRNEALDEVLDIINTEFAEKETPEGEGWYFNTEHQGFVVVYSKDNELWYWCYEFIDGFGCGLFENKVTFSKGKWISMSAVVSEKDGE